MSKKLEDEERIVLLERELIETRNAAVNLMVGLVAATIDNTGARERIAADLDKIAKGANPVLARIARLAAQALRN